MPSSTRPKAAGHVGSTPPHDLQAQGAKRGPRAPSPRMTARRAASTCTATSSSGPAVARSDQSPIEYLPAPVDLAHRRVLGPAGRPRVRARAGPRRRPRPVAQAERHSLEVEPHEGPATPASDSRTSVDQRPTTRAARSAYGHPRCHSSVCPSSAQRRTTQRAAPHPQWPPRPARSGVEGSRTTVRVTLVRGADFRVRDVLWPKRQRLERSRSSCRSVDAGGPGSVSVASADPGERHRESPGAGC